MQTRNKKASYIKSILQELVNYIAATKLINLFLHNIHKNKSRVAVSIFSQFYNSYWLIDTNKFPKIIVYFKKLIADFWIIDSTIQQLITNVVIFVVVIAVTAIQTKYENKMLSLYKIIEKSLFLRDFPMTIPSPDHDTSAKMSTPPDNLTKTTERWNQANLGYFDSPLDKAYRKREIISIGKDVYYKNEVFFVQRLQSLVTFKKATLVKANIAIFFWESALK